MKLTPYKLYNILSDHFGQQNWWPIDREYHIENNSDPRFEIIIGAILTQNTAWSNVEKALKNLKTKKILNIKEISNVEIETLQKMIKPSGFFNQKSKRVKNLASYIDNKYNSNLELFFNREIKEIREELLSIDGIGPETADSIILYAGNLPIFVVDAYTKRVCERIPLNTKLIYDDIQKYFEKNLSKKYHTKELTQIYNELHALIVTLAKNFCKKKPECKKCILQKNCMFTKKILSK